jgi:integrase
MIQSGRFCRNTINKYIQLLVYIFKWGVEEERVLEMTWRTLKIVKSLSKDHPGTFENPPREEVPDDVILRTLPFMPPTIRAMVLIQRLTGMRPSEIYNMRAGDIDRTRGNGLWYYVPGSHKTERYIGKKVIPLGKPEQELLAPYLENKERTVAVFSPRTAMEERNADKRVNRKTKIYAAQAERDKARATKPSRYSEAYNMCSYRQAIGYAIKKGNRRLPDEEKIPHWFPYQLRHAAGTDAEKTEGLDAAQALLQHRTANTTKRYAHGQLAITEKLARNRRNPFETEREES